MTEIINVNELEQAAGGQVIKTTNTGFTVYKTEANDSLWSLSQKFGVSVDDIFRYNKDEIKRWAKKFGVVCQNEDDYKNYLWIGEILNIPPKKTV